MEALWKSLDVPRRPNSRPRQSRNRHDPSLPLAHGALDGNSADSLVLVSECDAGAGYCWGYVCVGVAELDTLAEEGQFGVYEVSLRQPSQALSANNARNNSNTTKLIDHLIEWTVRTFF